jgi:hypothetical protein
MEIAGSLAEVVAGSTKDLKTVAVATAGTGSGTRAAILAGREAATAANYKRASGSTTSGSTTVCELTATSGYRFVAWHIMASQTQAANTALTITITYTDDTTVTDTCANNTQTVMYANRGGIHRFLTNATTQITAGSDKDIKKLTVTATNAGTGTRAAIISATEEQIPGGAAKPAAYYYQSARKAIQTYLRPQPFFTIAP